MPNSGSSSGETVAHMTARVTSSFMAGTTAMDVVEGHSLLGRQAIVTGGGSGIGLETVRALAIAGADVTNAARSLSAGQDAAERINAQFTHPRVDAMLLDLGDISSVRAFASEWGDRPLHWLINNAGVMAPPDTETRDGFEIHFGTNHLGHFLLSVLLTPALRRGAPARVISLTSAGHMRSVIDLADPHFRRRPYGPLMAYAQSKTANALFAVEFDRRHRIEGIQAFSVMPGMINTNTMRPIVSDALAEKFGLNTPNDEPAAVPFRTEPQGAATTVWAAVAPELDRRGGLYLQDCAEALPFSLGMPRGYGVMPYVLDPEMAKSLWELSAREVGLS